MRNKVNTIGIVGKTSVCKDAVVFYSVGRKMSPKLPPSLGRSGLPPTSTWFPHGPQLKRHLDSTPRYRSSPYEDTIVFYSVGRKMSQKLPFLRGGGDPALNKYMVPCFPVSPQPKRHLDPSIRFRTAHVTLVSYRQADHATVVTKCFNKIYKNNPVSKS